MTTTSNYTLSKRVRDTDGVVRPLFAEDWFNLSEDEVEEKFDLAVRKYRHLDREKIQTLVLVNLSTGQEVERHDYSAF